MKITWLRMLAAAGVAAAIIAAGAAVFQWDHRVQTAARPATASRHAHRRTGHGEPGRNHPRRWQCTDPYCPGCRGDRPPVPRHRRGRAGGPRQGPACLRAPQLDARLRLWHDSFVYFRLAWEDLAAGAMFGDQDVRSSMQSCVIGETVRHRLFDREPAVGKQVRIEDALFRIIGVLSSKSCQHHGHGPGRHRAGALDDDPLPDQRRGGRGRAAQLLAAVFVGLFPVLSPANAPPGQRRPDTHQNGLFAPGPLGDRRNRLPAPPAAQHRPPRSRRLQHPRPGRRLEVGVTIDQERVACYITLSLIWVAIRFGIVCKKSSAAWQWAD